MLPLARWIMQGRGQALGFVIVGFISSYVFWPNGILAAAALSLVWLRIGEKDGVLLGLWALLPLAAMAVFADSFLPLMLLSSVSLSSYVLRKTASWSYTLATLTATTLITTLCLDQFASAQLAPFVDNLNQLLINVQKELKNAQLEGVFPTSVESHFVAGLFGSMAIIGSFISLIMARFWQAALYNPGGFQQEFHQLRLSRFESIACVLLTGALFQLGTQYMAWAVIVLFPLLVASIALFHAYAGSKKMAKHWYVIFYIVLASWDPIKIVLIGLALADSFFNFRSKFPKNNN